MNVTLETKCTTSPWYFLILTLLFWPLELVVIKLDSPERNNLCFFVFVLVRQHLFSQIFWCVQNFTCDSASTDLIHMSLRLYLSPKCCSHISSNHVSLKNKKYRCFCHKFPRCHSFTTIAISLKWVSNIFIRGHINGWGIMIEFCGKDQSKLLRMTSESRFYISMGIRY